MKNITRNNIKQYLELLNKTSKAEFSRRLDISPTYFNDLEKEKFEPQYSRMILISRELEKISRELSKGKQILVISPEDVFYIIEE